MMTLLWNTSSPDITKKQKGLKVAILLSGFNQVTSHAKEGFIQALQARESASPFSFKIFDSKRKTDVLYSQIRTIIHEEYNLIFSIDTICTRAAFDITVLNNKPIPIVFSYVTNPVEQGLIDSYASSGNHLTGIACLGQNHQEQVLTVHKIKSNIRNALIIHDPSAEKSPDQTLSVKKACEKYGISVKCVNVMHKNDIYVEVYPHLAETDVLFTLREHVALQNMHLLSKLCNYFSVVLVASDLESITCGAAIGFGQSATAIGAQAAHKAYLILEEKVHPSTIPIKLADTPYKVFLNRESLKAQKLVLDPRLLFLMRSSEII